MTDLPYLGIIGARRGPL